MADGLNTARAMRVAEIMQDFKNIQMRIGAIRANPSAEEYNEDGFVILRQCVSAAQQLLARPFQKVCITLFDQYHILIISRIILDASVRRFMAQKIYLRAAAALRWISSRNAILQGAPPSPGHAPALQQIRYTLRTELASITDARVEAGLREADANAGKYTQEDPSLAVIQRMAGRDR
ncbi:uncharacterized protein MYCFIDRAFT_203630 [Pseudocercospora fijiensis CIRAD86]|uniref:Uncharacterized protein n=1 Tax=Pseudocercospora fijiensis (strain CIRAD86) TaxID=383855 RepID=M2ZWQ1_PSEFD|nr:uncharacterized protein MYCFIDRAFT_203630 [Pseudocercospora fijiensis CIRAD86]EME83424.1 hypothetical protein MYCFIDRAFT_203630 [Pseudocercospora fijiensis CIRAD86]